MMALKMDIYLASAGSRKEALKSAACQRMSNNSRKQPFLTITSIYFFSVTAARRMLLRSSESDSCQVGVNYFS